MASYAPAVSTGYAGVPASGATTYGMSGMGAMGHNPAMSLDFIKKTEEDTTGIIVGQADQQKKMLDHQYEAQKKMLEAEAKRTIDITTQQYQQQLSQAVMALDQSYKQQEMALNMAKQQRTMAITQQAAQMSAQAKQYELQMEMQKNLMSAYRGDDATNKKTERKK
jgi:hypothetical protein